MAYNPYLNYYSPMYQQGINNDRLAYLQNYQQQLPQTQPIQPQPQPQTFNQGLLWVQGEAGAKSYMVTNGATVLLMDSEASRFYIKSVDHNGIPSMRVFDYKEITQDQPSTQNMETKGNDYATHAEIADLKKEIADLRQKLEEKNEYAVQPIKRRARSDAESGADENGE